MLLDIIIGYALCALGGGIIGRVVAKTNGNTREIALSGFAIICLIAGAMVVTL